MVHAVAMTVFCTRVCGQRRWLLPTGWPKAATLDAALGADQAERRPTGS
jgi:hypothetical protein